MQRDPLCASVFTMQCAMGRTKSRIGRFPKNYEKHLVQKRVGRPAKKKLQISTPPTDSEASVTALSDLIDSPLPSDQWIIQNHLPDNVIICKVSSQYSSDRHSLSVTHCLTINRDLSWTLSVHGMKLDARMCPLLSKVSTKLSKKSSLQQLLYLLENSIVCPGHPDEQFMEMAKAKKGNLLSRDGKIVASVDDYSPVTLNGDTYQATVRFRDCEVLVSNGKCPKCVSYRSTLRKMRHRWSKQKSLTPTRRQSSRSRVNVRFLNTPEKNNRYRDLKRRIDKQSKEVQKLRIAAAMQANGVELEADMHSDLRGIMNEMIEKVHEEHPDGFRRIFWDQQLAALETNNPKQLRWHPAIINGASI